MTRAIVILLCLLVLPFFAVLAGLSMFATVLVHGAIAVWERA